ncbi:RimJ/RimL family protein N-acetyltransferase [Nitrosomonas sp. Nm84]|uniref:GNAT family N-acetyltransferase n=1 Tax=Nitrosomonas sp. Nm84 TaxID=200124 RepID=UPI000D77031D|nr:GNAT family protein [Nitrosomonas sp. Nm84]PXW88240.1 RimJ/RimL family protein N-acetyltransferase [Nitrosomonas sp. Nm84]
MKTLNCKLPDPAALYQRSADEKIPGYVREAGDLLALGDAKLCIDHLNKADKKNVESPWGWIVAATAHCQLGNFKTAVGVATRGLQYAGENSYLLDCLGVAHAGLGDLSNAKNSFQKAAQANAKNANSIINLANIHLLHNAIDLAFDVLSRGLAANPDDTEIRHLYIQLHPIWVLPIENERLRIRARTPLDHQFVTDCYANESFMSNYNRYLAGSLRQFKSQQNAHHPDRLAVYKNKSIQWVIERIDSLNPGEIHYTPIGLASLAEIHLVHRRAEILIGFPDATKFNGTRIPLTAMLMILDFAFNAIGFNKLTSIVYSDNSYAQKSALAIGFRQEGFFKNHLHDQKLNDWLSIYQNSMLIEEFKENLKLARFSSKLIRCNSHRAQLSLFRSLNF